MKFKLKNDVTLQINFFGTSYKKTIFKKSYGYVWLYRNQSIYYDIGIKNLFGIEIYFIS